MFRFSSNTSSTKEKLYLAAISMFSEYGYDNVTMADLSRAVGIKKTAFYNHFDCKRDILLDLFKTYSEQRRKVEVNLSTLLEMAETDPPIDVLLATDYQFPPEIAPMMNSIVAIAARGMATDADSRKFIEENVFTSTSERIVPLLTRLVELGRIEPLDINAINHVMLYHCFSAVALSATPVRLDIADLSTWRNGIEYLYTSLVKPTGK